MRMLAGLAALVLIAAPALAQQADEEVRARNGAWEVICKKGTDICVMAQDGNTADGKKALRVTVQRVQGATTDDGKPIPAAITVQAPLGILIPYGVRIKIDAENVVPLPLSRCIPAGCVAQAPMLDEAVTKMKRGRNAKFGIFLDQEVLVDISLSGFTKSFNSLQPVPTRR